MFKLKISTDNAAFEDDAGHEIARILRELADKMSASGFRVDTFENDYNERGNLRDINGNTVGEWTLK